MTLVVKQTYAAICGKVDALWKHTAECSNAPESKRQWAKDNLRSREITTANKLNSTLRLDLSSAAPSPHLGLLQIPPSAPTSTALSPVMNTPLLQLQPALVLPAGHLDVPTQPSLAGTPTLNEPELSHTVEPWKSEVQSEFAADLCRLLLVSNIAWWAVDHPYWRHFFGKWMPQCFMPGSKQLSGRILDEEATKVVETMKMVVHGKYATGQCDGWKNVNKASIIATTINVEYLVRFWLIVLDVFD